MFRIAGKHIKVYDDTKKRRMLYMSALKALWNSLCNFLDESL